MNTDHILCLNMDLLPEMSSTHKKYQVLMLHCYGDCCHIYSVSNLLGSVAEVTQCRHKNVSQCALHSKTIQVRYTTCSTFSAEHIKKRQWQEKQQAQNTIFCLAFINICWHVKSNGIPTPPYPLWILVLNVPIVLWLYGVIAMWSPINIVTLFCFQYMIHNVLDQVQAIQCRNCGNAVVQMYCCTFCCLLYMWCHTVT